MVYHRACHHAVRRRAGEIAVRLTVPVDGVLERGPSGVEELRRTAAALRNEMIANGRGEELEGLVRSARELQSELEDGPSD